MSVSVITSFCFPFAGRTLTKAVVKVTVDDVNDHMPEFDRAVHDVSLVAPAAASVAGATAALRWIEIAVVRATDADSGVCGHVFYVIVGGNDDGMFVVDQQTGEDPTWFVFTNTEF